MNKKELINALNTFNQIKESAKKNGPHKEGDEIIWEGVKGIIESHYIDYERLPTDMSLKVCHKYVIKFGIIHPKLKRMNERFKVYID